MTYLALACEKEALGSAGSDEGEGGRETHPKTTLSGVATPQQKPLFRPTSTDIPHEFICPITAIIIRDPVMTADGHTYERRDIEVWLANKATSPETGLPLRIAARPSRIRIARGCAL